MLLPHPARLLRGGSEPEERIGEIFDLYGEDFTLGEERLVEGPGGSRERFVMPEHFLQRDDAGRLGRGQLSLSSCREFFEAQ